MKGGGRGEGGAGGGGGGGGEGGGVIGRGGAWGLSRGDNRVVHLRSDGERGGRVAGRADGGAFVVAAEGWDRGNQEAAGGEGGGGDQKGRGGRTRAGKAMGRTAPGGGRGRCLRAWLVFSVVVARVEKRYREVRRGRKCLRQEERQEKRGGGQRRSWASRHGENGGAKNRPGENSDPLVGNPRPIKLAQGA